MYNEIEPYAVQWLRNLSAANMIRPGEVNVQSVEDLTAEYCNRHKQCHFFAGIGTWSYALRQAGWPDDREVWTASLPCQPFSKAGQGKGLADSRNLWPSFFWLIQQCQPVVIFGEQVGNKNGIAWFDVVSTDLEREGYAVGQVVFPACSVGAPHVRQRLYWVAYSNQARLEGRGHGRESTPKRYTGATSMGSENNQGPLNEYWATGDWLLCRDGKWRPTERGAHPLANGSTDRVGRISAYGNSIVAPQATEFIKAFMEVM